MSGYKKISNGLVKSKYGEAYIYDNAVNTIIETANIPIALRQISVGSLNGFTFNAGSTGVITSFQIGTGGAGFTRVNSVGHGLSNGAIVTGRGSTVAAYNGVHTVSSVSTDYYDIDATFSADGGVSDWDQGTHLIVGAGSAGAYASTWDMNTAPAAACTLRWQMYINAAEQIKSTSERIYENNSLKGANATAIFTVAEGDIIWLAVQSDGTANILNLHGNFNLHKL